MRKLLSPGYIAAFVIVEWSTALLVAGGKSTTDWLALSVVASLVLAVLIVWARLAPQGLVDVTLRTQTLKTAKSKHWIPLEEIVSTFHRHGSAWVVERSGRRTRIAEGLKEEELRWLTALVEQRRDMRLRALTEAGHDLSALPPELDALQRARQAGRESSPP
jgi:hypothetical protein